MTRKAVITEQHTRRLPRSPIMRRPRILRDDFLAGLDADAFLREGQGLVRDSGLHFLTQRQGRATSASGWDF